MTQELDERIYESMIYPAVNRAQFWSDSLEGHRTHETFRIQGWPMEREVGFTCSCGGTEVTWRLSLTSLRSMVPETRDAFQRLYSSQMRKDGLRNRREARAADKRAKALLGRHLTRSQRETLRAGFFDLIGQDGQTYRVESGSCQNVWRLDAERVKSTQFCLVAKGICIPNFDLMLIHKLMLELDMDGFMRVANTRELGCREWRRPDGSVHGIAAEHQDTPVVTRDDVENIEQWAAARLAGNQETEDGQA